MTFAVRLVVCSDGLWRFEITPDPFDATEDELLLALQSAQLVAHSAGDRIIVQVG